MRQPDHLTPWQSSKVKFSEKEKRGQLWLSRKVECPALSKTPLLASRSASTGGWQQICVRTTKSPRRVLVFAYVAAKLSLPTYAHPCSPKKFTQPQLFACLVLKEFLQLDYRKLAALLSDSLELQQTIDLQEVPHFTTFQKAARRLLRSAPAQRLLDATIHIGVATHRLHRRVVMAALDGTGFESHHASNYYVRRRGSASKQWQKLTYRTFPKAGILCDCASHMILAVVPSQGPGPDIGHFRAALDQARRRVRLVTLAADAGYDSEASHAYGRQICGIRTLIPPLIGRPTSKPPRGYWRRQMKARLHTTRYPARWQVETVHSMLKRLLGSALRARNYWSKCREMVLRSLTLNIMILRRRKVFYRARMSPLLFGVSAPREAKWPTQQPLASSPPARARLRR